MFRKSRSLFTKCSDSLEENEEITVENATADALYCVTDDSLIFNLIAFKVCH